MNSLDLVTMIAHAPPWARLVVSALMALWAFATTLTLALRAVPEASFTKMETASPALGHFFRAWRKFGTDVLPFLVELGKAFLKLIVKGPPAGPTAVLLLVCLSGGTVIHACGGTQVQTQADIASQAAQAWNEVGRPTLVRAYEEDQRGAVDRTCPATAVPCPVQPMRDAVQQVRSHWAPVWAATEAVRGAHDLWRTELESCRRAPDAGAGCLPDVRRLAQGFLDQTNVWRCAVRAVGHPELDRLPGTPQCGGGGSDAG